MVDAGCARVELEGLAGVNGIGILALAEDRAVDGRLVAAVAGKDGKGDVPGSSLLKRARNMRATHVPDSLVVIWVRRTALKKSVLTNFDAVRVLGNSDYREADLAIGSDLKHLQLSTGCSPC